MTSGDENLLSTNFDCVVMLVSYDWNTAPLHNHFYYARGLARHLPVIFVQPDMSEASFEYEHTDVSGTDVLHIYQEYGPHQRNLLNKALNERHVLKPLLWISNPLFLDFVIHRYAPMKIFYAPEDYLSSDFINDHGVAEQTKLMLQKILSHIDLLIATSENAIQNYTKIGGYLGESIILPNIGKANSSDRELLEQDYDNSFNSLIAKINSCFITRKPRQDSLNILVLYDDQTIYINTIREYLESFNLFSRSNIYYAFATLNAKCEMDLSFFDVIVIHYSVRLILKWHLSSSYIEALRQFGGYKVLYIQDEYDYTELARRRIESLGIHTVFTCVPKQYIELFYPPSRFSYTEFIQVLTGYISPAIENYKPKPLSQRKFLIGYRGRLLPYYYGNLCREKFMIAQKMRQICESRNLPVDIDWGESKRIYGNNWYDFLADCKATLGTESGSNIFDEYGEIRRSVEKALRQKPNVTYAEIYDRYLAEHEGKIRMNQISPRIFEAIALRTVLVLFEGEYSGIIKPDIHYIPLKKNFSNIDAVLAKLQDDNYLEQLTERAYIDIIQPGQYSYKKFIQDFDQFLAARQVKTARTSYISPVVAVSESATGKTEDKQKLFQTQIDSPFSSLLEQPRLIIGNGGAITVGALAGGTIIPILRNENFREIARIGIKILDSVYTRAYSLFKKDKIATDEHMMPIMSNITFLKIVFFIVKIVNSIYNKTLQFYHRTKPH